MKHLLAVALSLTLFLPLLSAPLHAGGDSALKAKISGSYSVEITTAEGKGKKVTKPITADLLFEEFGLSKADYDLGTTEGVLAFFPKPDSNAALVLVYNYAAVATVADGKTGLIDFVCVLQAPTAPAGLFAGLQGSVSGKVSFDKKKGSAAVKVVAIGTNTKPGEWGGEPLIKLVIKGTEPLTQAK